ncbi:MAG: hypothetical protein WKF82_02670 [Nocardioidaceae bacterium]
MADRLAPSTMLNVDNTLFEKTTSGGCCVGSGMAAACTTASWPSQSHVA